VFGSGKSLTPFSRMHAANFTHLVPVGALLVVAAAGARLEPQPALTRLISGGQCQGGHGRCCLFVACGHRGRTTSADRDQRVTALLRSRTEFSRYQQARVDDPLLEGGAPVGPSGAFISCWRRRGRRLIALLGAVLLALRRVTPWRAAAATSATWPRVSGSTLAAVLADPLGARARSSACGRPGHRAQPEAAGRLSGCSRWTRSALARPASAARTRRRLPDDEPFDAAAITKSCAGPTRRRRRASARRTAGRTARPCRRSSGPTTCWPYSWGKASWPTATSRARRC
jgi:hypothetical protein